MPPRFPLHAISSEAPASFVTKQLKLLWPFAVGFATTGYIFVKIGLSVTDEDVKQSKFVNPRH